MSIQKNILGLFKSNKDSEITDFNTSSENDNRFFYYDQVKKEAEELRKEIETLKEINLSTFEDLENLVQPLIRKGTKIDLKKQIDPPKNTQLKSHFRGQPYFEEGEEWVRSKSGRHMDFIFQIFNNEELPLPQNIKLLQFYYDWEESPSDTGDDGWFVKIYETLNTDKIISIDKPAELGTTEYCEVAFTPINSLPDWEGISLCDSNISKLSRILNTERPWENYDKVIEKLSGELHGLSQLGGYPKWVQGEETPQNEKGENMKLLFQIDSEEDAELMWGDCGLVYVFYDEDTKQIEFSLQCY